MAGQTLLGFEPKLIKLEFIIYLPKLKVYSCILMNLVKIMNMK